MSRIISITALIFFINASFAQVRMVPHLTAPGGGFETQLTLVNTTDAPHALMMAPFDSNGQSLPPVSLTLQPGETSVQDPQTLFPSGAEVLAEQGDCRDYSDPNIASQLRILRET